MSINKIEYEPTRYWAQKYINKLNGESATADILKHALEQQGQVDLLAIRIIRLDGEHDPAKPLLATAYPKTRHLHGYFPKTY